MKNICFNFLLFDADGTLFDFNRAEREALRLAFQIFGLGCDESTYVLYSEINESLWREHERGLVSKDKLKVLRFSRLFAHLKQDLDPLDFGREYLLQLGRCGYLYEGAEDICRDLSRNHELAIVTNGIASVQYPRFHSSPLADIIPRMFVSEEIGSQKPQVEFFTHVFGAMSITDKSDVLIIGDSLSADIQGGINAGISTCWYNPDRLANETDIEPTFEIADLQAIKDIV